MLNKDMTTEQKQIQEKLDKARRDLKIVRGYYSETSCTDNETALITVIETIISIIEDHLC